MRSSCVLRLASKSTISNSAASTATKKRGRKPKASLIESVDAVSEETLDPSTPIATLQPRTSAVHKGVAFEERSLKVLREHLSMSLSRVGGRDDGGVDLIGWWWLPPIGVLREQGATAVVPTAKTKKPDASAPQSGSTANTGGRRRIRVLAQCKAEKKKMGPNYVREMEGVLHRYMLPSPALTADGALHSARGVQHNDDLHPAAPLHPQAQDTRTGPLPVVALLISESLFTQSTILRALSSPVPFMLVHLPPLDSLTTSDPAALRPLGNGHGMLGSVVWNTALGGTYGLLGGELELRWERSTLIAAREGQGRPGLWWDGKKLESWVPECL